MPCLWRSEGDMPFLIPVPGRSKRNIMQDASAAILCGGKSCRMGFDKAFLKEGDSYLLQHNATRLRSMFERVMLVSDTAEKFAEYDAFDSCRIVTDHYPGTGPLGGICTALEESKDPYVFVMACDMPGPDLSLIEEMRSHLGEAQVVVCEHEGRFETLFAFYHRSCLPVFTRMIGENILKPRRAFDELRVVTLHLPPERADTSFINLNTPEDLSRYLAIAAETSPCQ